MVVYLKPATRVKIVATVSAILILLGVRAGIAPQGKVVDATAKIVPVSRVNTALPEVGLAVDVADAGAEHVKACLATLDSLGAKATWFVTATFAEAQEAAVKEIAARGHELGVKGTDEKRMDNLPQADIKDRLQRSRQALSKAGIQAAPFLYPPGQRYSDALVSLAFHDGYQTVKPGVDLCRGKEAKVLEKMAKDLKAGDILLVRIGKKGPLPPHLTAAAASVKDKGLSIVALSRLFRGVK